MCVRVCVQKWIYSLQNQQVLLIATHIALCAESTRLTEEQMQDQAVKEGEAFAKAAT